MWEPKVSNFSTICSSTKEEQEVKMWHRRLGHLHLRGMKKIISKEAVRGIPKLLIDEGRVCGGGQANQDVTSEAGTSHNLQSSGTAAHGFNGTHAG
jgi:hypothetical protein